MHIQRRTDIRAGLLAVLRRLRRDQRGAIAALFGVMVPLVVVLLGLAVEVGLWYEVKRHNQSAADIAAYSGALEIVGGGSSTQVTQAAKTDALTNAPSINSFTATTSPSQIFYPSCGGTSCSGAAVSTTSCVKVILSQTETPLVTSYFKLASFPINACGSAEVASTAACASGGLGKSNGTAIDLQGSGQLNLPSNCTLTSNSNSQSSINLADSAVSLSAYTIYTSGGIYTNGNKSTYCPSVSGLTVSPTCGGAALSDPYSSVSVPSSATGFTMPLLPSAVTTAPATSSLASPIGNQPTTLGGTAPSTTPQTTSCTTLTTPVTGNVNVNPGSCYTNAVVVASGGRLTVKAGDKGNGNNAPTSFNAGLTINSGGTVVFSQSGKFTPQFGFGIGLTINGTATFVPGLYGASTITAGSGSTLSFTNGGAYQISDGSGFQIGAATGSTATVNFQSDSNTSYAFYGGGLTVNATGNITFGGPVNLDIQAGSLTSISGSTVNIDPGSYYVENGSLTLGGTANIGSFTGNTNISTSQYALRVGGTGSSFALNGAVNLPATAPRAIAFYGGPLTIGSGSAITFPATNYCVSGGALTLNRNITFGTGTTVLNVTSGGISTASGATLTFPSSSSTSKFYINTGGSNGVTLGGTASLGNSSYYFTNYGDKSNAPCQDGNGSGGGSGVTLSSGSTNTFGGGVYSIQSGNLTISGVATFSSGTTCATSTASSCLYLSNGGLINAGTTTFPSSGTFYLYTPNTSGASILNSGTLNLGSSGSNNTYYINNASGAFVNCGVSDIGVCTSAGTLSFGGGTYYVSNGSAAPSGSTPNGGFSNAGMMTFAGGGSIGATNYYFLNGPSYGTGKVTGGTGSGACLGGGASTTYGAMSLRSGSTTTFGAANYYIMNGDLCIHPSSSGTAPTISGNDLTFILSGTSSGGPGGSKSSNISTVQIPSLVTTSSALTAAASTGCGTSFSSAGCTYNGLLIYQDRDALLDDFNGNGGNGQGSCNTNCNLLEGGSGMSLTGAIYLPQAALTFNANSGANCLIVIADEITLIGGASLDNVGCKSLGVQTLSSNSVQFVN